MGRKRVYTKKRLKEEVERYFASITRKVKVTEKIDTGRRDKSGHVIYEQKPVTNQHGQQLEVVEYLVPPTVGGLCEFLGIHRDTWHEYCQLEEFSDTTTRAQGRLRAWREEQLLTRKDVKGIIFDLENNYGYKEQKDVHITGSVEDFLREQGEGVQTF